jgi:hypothetical protein
VTRLVVAAPWLPTRELVATKHMGLRKRRGLMVAFAVLTIAPPVLILGIRLLAHPIDPAKYGPAGSVSLFSVITGLMAEFGFIVAAALGASAGSTDLTDGFFRQLVITGRSRLALYLARIPAGLAIVLPLAALGFTLLCVVTAYASGPQSTSLAATEMVKVGLWLEPETGIGFLVGLGLGSLMGQRTVPVILLVVLEIIVNEALPRADSIQFAGAGLAVSRPGPGSPPAKRGLGPRGVEGTRPAQRQPVMSVQVNGEGTDDGVRHVVDVHEGAELSRLGRSGREVLVGEDHNWAQHDGRDAGARGPCLAHLLGEPLRHAVRARSPDRVVIVDREIHGRSLAFGNAEHLS